MSEPSVVVGSGPRAGGVKRRSPVVFLPLALFLGLAGLFLVRLFAGDASVLPSALIDKPVPSFDLPPVAGLDTPGLASADLKAGKVMVVNVFASWCVPCHQEQPVLLALRGEDINLVGIAYKDQAENTRRFLGQDGNPYAAIGADASGRVGIDFGVYGVPETYVVRGDGTITAKITGPLSEDVVRQTLMPAIAKAREADKVKR